MTKHEAVDRLMEMASRKRVDPEPTPERGYLSDPFSNQTSNQPGEQPGPIAERGFASDLGPMEVLAGRRAGLSLSPAARSSSSPTAMPVRDPSSLAAPDLNPHERNLSGPSAVARGRQLRGRQILDAIRPMIPAVVGAMRLVDHGAVQALARLLPLLGGAATAHPAEQPALSAEQEQSLRALTGLEAAQHAARRDLDGLNLRLAAADDLLRRTRTQLERLTAEQAAGDSELRRLGDRARLLTAGLVILLMIAIAQMVVLAMLLHR